MDVGVAIGWLNTIMLGLAGILALGRWKHLRWFPVHALIISLFAVGYKLWLYNYEFYFFKSVIGSLFGLLALAEAWRIEAKGRQWWAPLVLLPIVIAPFIALPWELRYQLSQEALVISQALILPVAIRVKSPALTGWGIYGVVILISDITMSLFPAFSWPILRFIYPLMFSSMNVYWLWHLLEPERERVFSTLFHRVFGWKLVPARSGSAIKAVKKEGNGLPSAKGAGIYQFPKTVSDLSSDRKSLEFDIRNEIQEVNMRMEAIEAAIKTTAMITMQKRKLFLSPTDLSTYLGSTEEVAREFVEHYQIPKIPLTQNPEEWVIFRADVDEALGIE